MTLFAQADVTTGLVGWWKLNEGSGVSAPDSSGNGNNGAITGAVWSERQGRNCLSFDGNDQVAVPSAGVLTPSSMTLSIWAHIDNSSGTVAFFDKRGNDSGSLKGYALAASSGPLYAVTGGDHKINGAGIAATVSNTNSTGGGSAIRAMQNRWQHFAFTYSAAGTQLYINGVLVDSTPSGISLPANTPFPLHLGFSPLYGYMTGALRDARLYNRALTAPDIQELYQSDALPGPRSHYALESNAQDGSGNAQHGSIVGTPVYVRSVVGRGLKLQGAADEVNIGPDQRLEVATVAAFVRLDEAASGPATQNIITSWEADQNYVLGIERDALGQSRLTARFRKRQDSTHAWPEQAVISTTILSPGIFHHAGLSYDGGTLRLFINGQEEASSALSGSAEVTAPASPPDVRVGHITAGTSALNGTVDEVRIYDRALSAYEIRMLASGAKGQVVYDHDFDSPGGPSSVFSSESNGANFTTTPGAAQRPLTKYLGSRSTETNATFRALLPEVPAHTHVTVAFDLYITGGWTGSATNHRLLSGSGSNPNFVPIMDGDGGVISFDSTFANADRTWQRFPSASSTGLNPAKRGAYETNSLGYGQDAVYRIVKTIPHSLASLFFDIHRPGTAVAGQDWGIDNVVISVGNEAPLVDVFSLSGTVGGTSLPAGAIHVQASTARPNSMTDQVTASANAFAFAALSAPDHYIVSGFVDANSNGIRDPYEWVGTANGGALLYLDSNTTGIHIVIAAPVDNDRDGLSDEWELENGLIVGTKDAALDKDSDGLTNAQEYWLGTGVNVTDSDGDGQTDGQEWLLGINPLGTDSDGDGMPDAWEIANGLDPRRNDTAEDRDFDFITNLQEFTNGTNPDSADSDNDGISDYQEVNGKTNWLAIYDKNNRLIGQRFDNGASLFYGYDANSNPVRQVLADSPDKDRDGILDIWELIHGLNPNLRSDGYADSDSDGVSNYQEYLTDTDPMAATSSTVSPGTVIGSVTLPFTPTAFVLATGQIDGSGPEEVVVGGDGDPGAAANSIRILTQQPGGGWAAETLDVGPVGVTSIAIGQGNPAPIFVGTRAVSPGFGTILKLTKSGGTWSSAVLLTSLDEVAFAACVQSAGSLVAQFTSNGVAGEWQRMHNVNPTTGIGSYNGYDTGLKSLAPYYSRSNGADVAVVRQTITNPSANMQALGLGGGQNIATDPYETMVLPSPVPYYTAAVLRSRAIAQARIVDSNGSGTLDGDDHMIVVESSPSNSNTTFPLFAPSSTAVAIGSVRPASMPNPNRDAVVVGDADGNVSLLESTANSGPLRKHHLTSAHRGKAWHQFKSWRTTAHSGDGLAGVMTSSTTPMTAEVVLWTPETLSTTAATPPAQSAPRTRIASSPNAGSASSNVPVDVWDAEGNPSRIALQYRPNAWSAWQSASVMSIDGGPVDQSFAASPDGTRHTLAWNALADAGASFRGFVLLRARAADAAETGAWSEQAAYFISTLTPYETWAEDVAALFGADAAEMGDFDLDGLSNLLEYATFTDARRGNAAPISNAPSAAGIEFFYRRNKAATDVAYVVEWSDTLQNDWSTAGVGPHTVVPGSDDGVTQLMKAAVPLHDGVMRRFARLKVIKP